MWVSEWSECLVGTWWVWGGWYPMVLCAVIWWVSIPPTVGPSGSSFRRMLHSLLVVCEPGNIFMFYTFAPASLSSAPRMVMGWGDIGGKAGLYQMYKYKCNTNIHICKHRMELNTKNTKICTIQWRRKSRKNIKIWGRKYIVCLGKIFIQIHK